MRPWTILILPLALLLLGFEADKNFLNIEKKYHLKDCMVKINFDWEKGTDFSHRSRIVKAIFEHMFAANNSGLFPLFFGGTVRGDPYFLLYYADRCEERRTLTNKLIETYFIPNIQNFPSYQLQDKGMTPGFDGALPSGFWK